MKYAFALLVFAGCSATPVTDAGVVIDSGSGDGGPPPSPLELAMTPVLLPQAPIRLGLIAQGNTLLSVTGRGVEATEDFGGTWVLRSTNNNLTLAGATDSTVWASSSMQVLRSDDGALSFMPVTVPASVAPTQSPPPRLHLAGDGTVWLTSRASPISVVRGLDGGASFEALNVPAGTNTLKACRSPGEYLAVRNGTQVVREADGGLEAVLDAPAVFDCLLTSKGAVLASGTDGTPAHWRIPNDGGVAVKTAAASTFYLLELDSLIYRYASDGRVDVSMDDGASFTARVAQQVPGFGVAEVSPVGQNLVGLGPGGGVAILIAGTSGWQTSRVSGFSGVARVVDFAFARDSSAAVMLTTDGVRHTVFAAVDGVNWFAGRTFEAVAGVRAVAVHPKGTGVFVGGTQGRFWLLDATGTTELHAGQVADQAGNREIDPIQQASWQPDVPAGSYLMVTSANDSDTRGNVWSLDAEATHYSWVKQTPVSTGTGTTLRLGGFHALAISQLEGGRGAFLGFRSFVSTNSFLPLLLSTTRLFDANRVWERYSPPVAPVAAISASIRNQWGSPLAVLWPNGRLHVGPYPDRLRPVPLPPNLSEVSTVRFAKDGRLWLGGQSGLWRTVAPVGD